MEGADRVPMGTEHVVTGLLLLDRGYPVLEVDGGGTWRLQIGRNARCHIGHRVTIEGVRVGFDELDVDSIRSAGMPVRSHRSWWRRLLG